METIIGLLAIYIWVHGSIIVGTKVKGTTTYENVVLIAGLVTLVLLLIGSALP